MSTETNTRTPHLERQRCVRCGYDGPDLQGPAIANAERMGAPLLSCPRCQQDLYTRPPRSYAELEGFSQPTSRPTPPRVDIGSRRRLWRNSFALMASSAASTLTPRSPRRTVGAFTRLELALMIVLVVVVSVVTVSRIVSAAS